MIKNIFKQLWNQRRANGWIAAELLLVSVFLWVIADQMSFQYEKFNRPMGFDIENTHQMYLDILSSDSEEYIAPEESGSDEKEDLMTVLARIRSVNGVEALSISSCAKPYSPCNNAQMFMAVHGSDSLSYNAMARNVTPEYFKVFHIMTPDNKLAGQVYQEKLVLSQNIADTLRVARGDSVHNGWDNNRLMVVDVCTNVCYAETWWGNTTNAYVVVSENEWIKNHDWPDAICVRFTRDMSEEQRAAVWEQIKTACRVNNLSFFHSKPFKEIRESYLSKETDEIKSQCWYVVFLLTNIFLGVVGTFWFRTQHRRSEIGLRLAIGASRRSIFTQLISEGLILLAAIMIVVIIVMLNVAYFGLLSPEGTALRFFVSMFSTWLFMSVMIVAGIWYPARQAMKIEPAEALHEE